MNQTTEALYLALLNSGKLETEATQSAFCEAYDYIIDLTECESNENEDGDYTETQRKAAAQKLKRLLAMPEGL